MYIVHSLTTDAVIILHFFFLEFICLKMILTFLRQAFIVYSKLLLFTLYA